MYTIVEDAPFSGGILHLPKRPLPWPIAFYNTDVESWCTLEQGNDFSIYGYFCPLTDMNDAWKVLRYAAGGKPGFRAPLQQLAACLLGARGDVINAIIALGAISAWTPERLCRAILRAYGVEDL